MITVLSSDASSLERSLFKAKVGINQCQMKGIGDVDTKIKFAPMAGLGLTLSVKGRFSLQAEVNFTIRGFKYIAPVTNYYTEDFLYDQTVDYSMGYLEFPILLRYRFIYQPSFKAHLYSGLSVSQMLYEKLNDIHLPSDYPAALVVPEEIEWSEIGMIIGGNLDFPGVSFEARSYFALSRFSTSPKLYNRDLSLIVGFPLQKSILN
jgi:hypothetical protein